MVFGELWLLEKFIFLSNLLKKLTKNCHLNYSKEGIFNFSWLEIQMYSCKCCLNEKKKLCQNLETCFLNDQAGIYEQRTFM